MKLVKDAKRAWRWFSVQAMTLATAIPAAWLAIPKEWQEQVPGEWLAVFSVVMGVLGVIGRLVDQHDA